MSLKILTNCFLYIFHKLELALTSRKLKFITKLYTDCGTENYFTTTKKKKKYFPGFSDVHCIRIFFVDLFGISLWYGSFLIWSDSAKLLSSRANNRTGRITNKKYIDFVFTSPPQPPPRIKKLNKSYSNQ